MAVHDPFGLQRIVDAQDPVYAQVLAELHGGRKTSHWMWFVFPQLAGLGRSATARFYGIRSLAEAQAYLRHPLLGPRLQQCTQALLGLHGRTALEVFGTPDDLKLCSCLTLFAQADPAQPLFGQALARYCGGRLDAATLDLLGIAPTPGG